MLPFSTLFSSHIRFLLQSLDGSNSDSVFCELCKCTEYGAEGSILLLCICLEHIDIYGEDLRNIQPDPAIRGLFKYLLEKPNFSTLFCQSVRSEAIRDGFLDNLSDAFSLSVSERIAIGLALLESENDDTQNCGKTFCLSQIEGLTANPSALDSTKQIQQILTFLCQSEDLSKHVDTLNSMLSLVPLEESYPSILNLLTSNEFDEATLLRNLDFLYDGENDFDGAVTETEREVNIAGLMKELSYGCTDDAKKCKYILSFISPLTESTISRIIGTVCCTQGGVLESQNAYQIFLSATGYSPSSDLPVICSWNINLLVDTIKELAPDTNWVGVMEKLDYDRFCIPDEDAFVCLMSIYKLASQDPFPLHSICGSVWNNAEGQLSILKHAVSSPAEVFSFSHSARQVEIIDSIQGLKQSQPSNHAWFCLDLLDVLCQLAEKGYKASVLSILEYPRKTCPEFLLLGMAQCKTAYNLVQNELSISIFPSILCSNHKNGVIQQIWLCNPLLLMRVVAQALVTDADNITEIVDICNDMKVLDYVLKMIPFAVAIRLAVAAFRKEIVDLEKWLTDNIITYQDTFYEECVKYLKEIQCVTSQQEKIHNSVVSSNIHTQHVAVFLKVLQANSHLIGSSNLCDEMDKLSISLKHGALAQNDGNADASATLTYDNDIEVEANSYFQRMFSEQLTLSEMVQMLSHFKDSSDPREKSIFECVINNLIEEYRFFPKYPEKQLGLAAVLFGSVIKNQLVTHLTLGIAIRYVLDSLRKPADSKMFGFGTKALEQFINRLEEWPQYCNHILQISHLRGTHPELVAYIEGVLTRRSHGGSGPPVDHLGTSTSTDNMNELTGSNRGELEHQLSTPLKLQSREHSSLDDANRTSANTSNILKPPLSSTTQYAAMSSSEAEIKKLQSAVTAPSVLSPSPGVARPSRGITSTRFGSALNIETLLFAAERRETPIEAPASEVQDKVSFIINNLSVANIEVKAKEFCEILKEPYYPWFAQYMVMKRASIEPNFHELYLKFLDKANSKDLNKEVVQTTYENCKVLLGSELIKSSSEERSLLKNLGSWLGKLTIGRNQVLRARDIDPKSLIVEAYEKGLMIAVIPFTSKILEPCQSSLAYQPPNPWTMGILALLAEIYAMPNLKMNLKFDIEVLFKNLGVNMKDVTSTSLLKDRVRVVEGNPDFSNKDTAVSHPLVEDKPGKMAAQNQLELPLEVAGSSHLGGAHSRSISPYGASGHSFIEDEKLGEVGFPDQLSAAQGLLPSAASQSPFNNNQLSAIACITQHIVVNPKITAVGLHPHFQSVLPVAMERAINEIVPGFMQRSVSIAIQTTKEIVIKDYALESDESRIYNAAHLMAGSLAGSLAHVTCKEHLRTLLTVQLRNVLQSLNIANELLEPAILNATNDNLDLGCAHLENTAADKAIEMVDAEISQQLTLRRKQSLASSMYDVSGLGKGPISVVPETLQPKPGRVSLSQQRVYEDFVRLPWQNQQTSPSTNSMLAGSPAGANLSRPFNLSSVQLNPGVYPSGLGNSVLGAAQPRSLASDEIDMPLPQIFSAASLNPGRNTDVAVQMRPDIDATVRGSSSTPGISELLPVDSSISVKDSVTPSQSLPIPSAAERVGTGVSEPLLTTGDALDKYQMVASKLEALLANDGREIEYQSIVSEVPRIILRCITRDEAALAVAQKVFKALYENSSNSFHVGAHLAILAAIRDVSKLVVKELTNWVIYSDEERKFNRDITVGLVRRDLLNLAEYNIHIAKLLDAGRNKAATEFSISLVQTLVSEQPKVLSELHSVVDALDKLASRPGSPESLQQLVEIAKNPSDIGAVSGIIAGMDDKSRQIRDQKAASQTLANRGGYNHIDGFEHDSSRFHEQVSLLFAEWFHICEVPAANVAAASNFTLQLHQRGFLNGDDTSDRFFHVLLELSVSHCLTTEVMSTQQSSLQAQPLSFLAIDIYAKLVFSILKYFPVEQGSSRLFLLPKILAATVRFIQKDADEKQSSFNARPYFRLFIDWLSDIGSLDPIHDGVNLQVLTAFANAFHAVQPLKVPAFSFAWLELVSHRTFMPKLLTGNSQKGWPYLHRLLVALFQFMDPFLRNAELGEAIRFLYKGTLRVLLVLLHDFPEFLCDYHFSFCDVIPPSCIQMRNIVLSAFPRNMRLPDPSTPNLKIDLLVEMSQPPRLLTEVEAALKTKQMKADVDEYLKVRQPQGSSLLSELKQKLLLSQNEANHTGTRYNVPLISSLVLYIGIQTIQQLQTRTPSQLQSMSNSALVDAAALDILYFLITELDTEGRYLFLNAIANQLRYPNNHTHYFSFILLHLFLEANQEVIQEQITRVLLERLIVNRPHPWGLLVTFIELIKNPKYSFWNRSFTRCAPEIEKLFESVSRSCGGLKPVNEGLVGSGAH